MKKIIQPCINLLLTPRISLHWVILFRYNLKEKTRFYISSDFPPCFPRRTKSICLSQQSSTYRGMSGHLHGGLLLLRTERVLVKHGENERKQMWRTSACPGHNCVSHKGTLKSPAQWSCVACAPFTLVTGSHMGSPRSCHPWNSLAWPLHSPEHLFHHSISDSLHPDQIVYRERKNENWTIKITYWQNLESFLGPPPGEQSFMLTPCMISCGLMYKEFFLQ